MQLCISVLQPPREMSSLINPYLTEEETGSEIVSDSPQVSVSERQTWDVDPGSRSWFSSPASVSFFLAKKGSGWGRVGGSGAWEQDVYSLKSRLIMQ